MERLIDPDINNKKFKMRAILSLLLYCVFTSCSSVWVSYSFLNVSGITITFVTILISEIVFLFYALKLGLNLLYFIRENIQSLLFINILTLISWLFMFMALQRMAASIESAIYQGWIPIIILILNAFFEKNKINRFSMICAFGILFSLLVVVLLKVSESDALNAKFLQGVLLATVAGITGAIYMYESNKLKSSLYFSVNNLLSSRFILLIIITGMYSGNDVLVLAQSSWTDILNLILLSITFIVIPIFTLQYSIAVLGTRIPSLMTPLVPIFALSVEAFLNPGKSILIPIFIILSCLFIVVSLKK
jgi:drug/metabolite transporter (DMT)-like permease